MRPPRLRFPAALSLIPILTLTTLARANGDGQGERVPGDTGNARIVTRLVDGWSFRVDGQQRWHTPAILPSAFEAMAGIEFDGVGWYRTRIERAEVPPGRRVFLRFDAVATHATVLVDGQEKATHLGGWTPFRVDLTDALRDGEPGTPLEVQVRVDERVGHNTQGFLPIVQPHFGGIWQDVWLETVPEPHLDDLRILAVGDVAERVLQVEAPVVGAQPGTKLLASYRRLGEEAWSVEVATAVDGDEPLARWRLPVAEASLWTPEQPTLYEVRLRVPASGDQVITRAAFRSIRADADQLLLNDRPLTVRGMLDWGYAPPHLAPTPDPDRFRRELEHHRERGFNLIKFCLWVPPKAYLDLCDETGMLAWVEYPTWHPRLDGQHREELEAEFTEFFAHDRNHPSVILRSLTCETGTSADLAVIQSLYDTGKRMIPGSLIEDDSSWIEWQRVFDFYDDHPYGNNHTWVPTLNELKAYMAAHGPKPLVLGEAITGDTWADPAEIRQQAGPAAPYPYWVPGFLDANAGWLDAMRQRYGPSGHDRLVPDSLRYSLLMRKYQVEIFRREIPRGGYVMSVHRDIPLAGMGLVDYLGRPKWSPEEWLWHGPTQLYLTTPGDRRSIAAARLPGPPRGGEEEAPGTSPFLVGVSRDGGASPPAEGGPRELTVELGRVRHTLPAPGEGAEAGVPLDPGPQVAEAVGVPADQPSRVTLRASLRDGATSVYNAWPIWIVPAVEALPAVQRHASVDDATARLFDTMEPIDGLTDAVIVARRFDADLLDRLDAGARVLMLPDGQRQSFATSNHWFLRGAPYLPGHPGLAQIPGDLLVDLQTFDLAGPVLPRIDPYLDQIDPLLLLWDNHDAKTVSTHGLVFETRVGRGRLLVSALQHGPRENPAGRWLLNAFLQHLASGPEPRRGLASATVEQLRERLGAESMDLSERAWRFRPDAENRGLDLGWHTAQSDTTGPAWSDIRIDRHWESQGHDRLDGWAFYRTTIDVPAGWAGREVYVSFQGADDYYELYVDGQKAGSGGDIATKRTAFEDRTSHRVTELVRPGGQHTLAVRVYDWYGAGGIFRPVLLGTARLGEQADWVR